MTTTLRSSPLLANIKAAKFDALSEGLLIVAFNDEIRRLRSGLRLWPPASDQIAEGKRIVVLMRMREQLKLLDKDPSLHANISMSPASATSSRSTCRAGLDDDRIGRLVAITSKIKHIQDAIGTEWKTEAEKKEGERCITELKDQQKLILREVLTLLVQSKRQELTGRAKL